MSVYVGNRPARVSRGDSFFDVPMPFSTRYLLGQELNKLWREFTEDMHDGPLVGSEVAEKFWRFVTSRG